MIEISQHKQNIIGSNDAIAALSQKDHARLLVLSDSHGNYAVFEKIIRDYGAKCDALIFCGDGVGDIARLLYAAKAEKKLMDCVPPVIAAVRGNCDPGTYPLDNGTLYFSTNSERIKFDLQKLPPKTASGKEFTCTEITASTIPEDFVSKKPHRVWQ